MASSAKLDDGTPAAIMIPVRGAGDLAVEVPLDDLPEDPGDVLDILKAELAPLNIWLRFAIEYYKQGRIDGFKAIIQEGSDPRMEQYYGDQKKERIAILNAQAMYHIHLARNERDAKKRDENLIQATLSYNAADRIHVGDETVMVGKGVLLLARGDYARASNNFDAVEKNNTAALLGKAVIQYNRGNYEEALNIYKKALKTNPSCPANVRLGLAFCYNRLGRPDVAKTAFERVLQLDPNNVEALVGLSVLEINNHNLPNALKLCKKAYELSTQHPRLLNQLSNYFFLKKDYEKAQVLARHAASLSDVDQIKAEAAYYLGRSFQAQGKYSQAFNNYHEAVRLWPEFALAQYGLGQMYIYKEDVEKAISCFEVVLQQYPDNYETLKVLSSLYAATNRKEKAIANLKRVTEMQPRDLEAWIEYAQLLEQTDCSRALKCYEKAVKLLKSQNKDVPYELYNNIGAHQQRLGDFPAAEESYKMALQANNDTESTFGPASVTVVYNLARVYEEQHKLLEAEALYKAILSQFPDYHDCHLRLGCIAAAGGHTKEAINFWKGIAEREGVDSPSFNAAAAQAWTLLGKASLEKEQWQQAQKNFEKVLAKEKHDLYSLLALGNIFYDCLTPAEKKEKVDKCLKLATDYFLKTLHLDPSNIYAANGLGIVMAEKGYIEQAKDIFVQVREATADIPDIWINLAHIYFSQGQFTQAIQMYQNCLKRFLENKDTTVLLFLARSYFEAGMLTECKDTLLQAIHIRPDDMVLWFDLALTHYEFGNQLQKKEKRKLTSAELNRTIADLRQAAETFKGLSENKREPRYYSTSKAGNYQHQCTKLANTLQERLQEIVQFEKEQEERRAKDREWAESYERKKKEKEEEERRKREEEEERIAEIAKRDEEKVQRLKEQWAQEAALQAKEAARSLGKRKRDDSPPPEDEEPEYQAEAESEDEEAPASPPPEDGEEDEGDGERKRQKKFKKSKKSKQRKEDTEGSSSESWRERRDRMNPMAKHLAKRKQERESFLKKRKEDFVLAEGDEPEAEPEPESEPEPEPEPEGDGEGGESMTVDDDDALFMADDDDE